MIIGPGYSQIDGKAGHSGNSLTLIDEAYGQSFSVTVSDSITSLAVHTNTNGDGLEVSSRVDLDLDYTVSFQ